MRRPAAVALVLGLLFAVALGAIALLLAVSHDQAQEQRKNTREAVVLLAHAECAASLVLESAALQGAKSPQQVDRILEFFVRYTAPVNEALRTLGAPICPERSQP